MTASHRTQVEEVLSRKWADWKLPPQPAEQSLAVILLADADQHNQLDLDNPLGTQQAEAELEQLFLQSPAKSDQILQAAVEEADRLENLGACETPVEAANLLEAVKKVIRPLIWRACGRGARSKRDR